MKTVKILFAAAVCLLSSVSVNAQSAKGKSEALYTIGYSGGVALYNTYCLVGSLNDGYWNNSWTKEYTLQLLDEQKTMMKNLSVNYDNLVESKFWESTADSATIVDMSAAAWKIRSYASALEDYINNEDSDYYRQAYLDARDAAWNAVDRVINSNEETAKLNLKRHDTARVAGTH
jgi:hypothetical protein